VSEREGSVVVKRHKPLVGWLTASFVASSSRRRCVVVVVVGGGGVVVRRVAVESHGCHRDAACVVVGAVSPKLCSCRRFCRVTMRSTLVSLCRGELWHSSLRRNSSLSCSSPVPCHWRGQWPSKLGRKRCGDETQARRPIFVRR